MAGALLAGGAMAQNLISNGDFEANLVPLGNYVTVLAGGAGISGWTVGGSSVDLIHETSYGSISGISVDLAGTPGPGWISQGFTAVAGQTYDLTFDFSQNMGSFKTTKLLLDFGVGVGGSTFTIDTSTFTPLPQSTTFSFVATSSGPSTVKFSTMDDIAGADVPYSGPVIDNVSLLTAAVPEPGTYALMFAGLGMVGMLARRRSAR